MERHGALGFLYKWLTIYLTREMGLMHITGPRDGPPVKVGVAVTDLTTGMYAANSILAAIIERARSGQGQHLDVCLSDCQVATLSNMAESVLVTGKRDTGRWGTSHRKLHTLLMSMSDVWITEQLEI